MIPGDRQMKGVAGPKSGFKTAKILLRETEIVRIRQNDRKGLGARRRVGIQLTHANLSGEQRGELDPGPMADRELRRRQRANKRCDLAARRFRKNQGPASRYRNRASALLAF